MATDRVEDRTTGQMDGIRPTSLQMFAWTMGIGLSAGAMFSVFDLVRARIAWPTWEMMQMVAWLVCIAACIALPVALAIALVYRFRTSPPKASLVLSVLAGLACQLVLFETLRGRLAIITLPLPWILAVCMFRCLEERGAVRLLARSFSMVGLAVVVTPVLLAIDAGSMGRIMATLLCAVVVTVAYLVQRMCAEKPTLVLVSLFALAGGLAALGQQQYPWDRQSVVGDSTTLEDAQSDTPPNIVLVVMDTTRRDHLGCYGHDGGLTPVVDKIAAEGTMYTQMIAPSSWTVPSHASLFTGLYPVTHGCSYEHHRWLDDEFTTLAEMLSEMGYQTAALVANGYLSVTNQLQGFDESLQLWTAIKKTKLYYWANKIGLPAKWGDHGVAEAVEALDQWLARRDQSKPFFVFVNLMEAHYPLNPPMRWRSQCLEDGTGYLEATRRAAKFYGPKWNAGQAQSEDEAGTIRQLYAGSIAYQDYQLGRMFDTLESHVDLDNTMIIVTADHGENLGEANRWGHVFAVNDVLIHVPFIVRYPSKFTPGQEVDGQCQLIDVIPTVFDVLQKPVPIEALPGRTLLADKFEPRQYTYSQVHPYYGHFERLAEVTGFQRDTTEFTASLRTIRDGTYKFVWSSRGRHRLFNILDDKAEQYNLIASKTEKAAELGRKLDEWWADQLHYEPSEEAHSDALDKETLEKLRSLGYAGDK